MLEFLSNLQNENKTSTPEPLTDNEDLVECEELKEESMEDLLLELDDNVRYRVRKHLYHEE
jgi:hypothetical protein